MSGWKHKHMLTGTLQGCAFCPRACQHYLCTGEIFTERTLASTLYFGGGGYIDAILRIVTKSLYKTAPVLGIRVILVRIRIPGSVPLTN